MNKIKIISEGIFTKIFIDDKEIEGITEMNLKQEGGELPELNLIIKGDLDIELDEAYFNITNKKE